MRLGTPDKPIKMNEKNIGRILKEIQKLIPINDISFQKKLSQRAIRKFREPTLLSKLCK
jgi:hypothetical protein